MAKNKKIDMGLMTVEELKNKIGSECMRVIVTFIKRTNGQRRVMDCTRNFKMLMKFDEVLGWVAPNGKGLPYDAEKHGLVVVWDNEKKDFRTIPAGNVLDVLSSK